MGTAENHLSLTSTWVTVAPGAIAALVLLLLEKVVILAAPWAVAERLKELVGTYFPFLLVVVQGDGVDLFFGESPQHVSLAAINLWLQSHTQCTCNLLSCPLCPVEVWDQQFPFHWKEEVGTV